ncbi:hypothetical protein P154DRAFT_581329 [Amniculicola lignicola CBS 123094]|uniref:Uncharacterized protein n=1 Tax=Amniculicola lignicola CBS 123094 TaxID=1392246 RepID=A0A6A5VZE3_9PLEO|nr:hypothetical protein P154DRAFT_581329 [Amniculicola lignicola CBS 123094]
MEMEMAIQLYGKLPLGDPKLMTSFTKEEPMPEFDKVVGERDDRFGSDYRRKREKRAYIEEPHIHENADATWKK